MNLLLDMLIVMFFLGGFVTCGLGASLSEGHSVPNWALFSGLTMLIVPMGVFLLLFIAGWVYDLVSWLRRT